MKRKIVFIFSIFCFFFYIITSAQSQVQNKMRIAILSFKADGVPVSTANKVTELLRVELVKTNKYIVVERTQMEEILKEQGFQQTGCVDESCAVKIGKLLSANKILIGNVMELGDMLVITSRIVDVEKGNIELAEKQNAKSTNDIFDAVQILAKNLTSTIEQKPKSSFFSFLTKSSESTKPASDEYYPEFKAEDDMKPLITRREPYSISYGGWINSSIIDDRSGNSATGTSELISSVSMAKVWLKTALPFNSYVYLRARDIQIYYIEKPKGLDPDNENYPDLDVGFLSISSGNNAMKFTMGRKFFLLGTGLVFNGRGDGGEFNFASKYIDLQLFGAYTGLLCKDTNPYRLSTADISDEGKRVFGGGSVSKTIYNQTLYLMGLFQTDLNDDIDDPNYPGVKADYRSQYYGAGLKGIFQNAFYFGEYVIEHGKSYTDFAAGNEKHDIKAYAAVIGINYYFELMLRPVLLVDYAYGSGDPDKASTSSKTGNTAGEDKGFLYFGTYTGGFALRPYLSNIHIYRAGFALSPLDRLDNRMFNRINIIARYSNYQKDIKNGSINQGEASEPKKDIGQGIDIALRWQVFSDLSVIGNYGFFIPGSAYDSGEKKRSFIMAGIYLAF